VCPASSARVTLLLANWGHGDRAARGVLIPLAYEELRRTARRYLRRKRPDHTLQSAALVHESYLPLVKQQSPLWQDRAHFFGGAAQLMRQILVDHARNRLAAKRGAGNPRLSLDPQIALPQKREVNLVLLDDALDRLAGLDPQQARPVEPRFFGNLSIKETAVAVKPSPATAKREWTTAQGRIQRKMKDKDARS
jgi:RNA polymerase sigma factor (TIGR02999 family)